MDWVCFFIPALWQGATTHSNLFFPSLWDASEIKSYFSCGSPAGKITRPGLRGKPPAQFLELRPGPHPIWCRRKLTYA